MNEKVDLSVAIITKNEEHNIAACLKSVTFAKQVVVVDAGSADRTAAIAAECGCDVYSEQWQGFGRQKQRAIDRCTCPWVLVLDADERIPEETARTIRGIVTGQSAVASGFSLPRKNNFQGRWIRHGGWWPDRVVRLFRRNAGRMTADNVHEAVVIDGSIEQLDCPLEHYPESSLGRVLTKINLYSTLGAEKAFAAGKTATVLSAAVRAELTFYQKYIVRGGILDGSQGLLLAMTDAMNKFCKYAKLAELCRAARTSKND